MELSSFSPQCGEGWGREGVEWESVCSRLVVVCCGVERHRATATVYYYYREIDVGRDTKKNLRNGRGLPACLPEESGGVACGC